MSRKLKVAVLHGAVFYEAGTDESDIRDADAIEADVWDGEAGSSSVSVSVLSSEELEKAAKALAEANATIATLEARVADLEAELTSVSGADSDTLGPYDGLDVEALKAEIDKRNEGRDSDKLDKRGGKDALVARLVADDESQEG